MIRCAACFTAALSLALMKSEPGKELGAVPSGRFALRPNYVWRIELRSDRGRGQRDAELDGYSRC